MTIPKSRAFSCTKGFQAQADVGINSPVQTNSQNVNVIVSPLTKDRDFEVITDKSNVEHKELPIKKNVDELKIDKPLDYSLENNFKERSKELCSATRGLETAKESLEEMESLLKDKDNLIEALSLILDIYENNPFIVNRFIVAQEDELTRLLFLLTGAEEIQLIKSDPEVKCCSKKIDKVQYISMIMVKKNGNTYNFKYSFPNVVQLLDNRRISWKLIV